MKDHVRRVVRVVGEFFEDQWFDRTRHVRTAGNVSLRRAGIAQETHPDSELYVPARPRHIRRALRAMPVEDVSGFTYVDLGCGKGRSMFVAAELPFRRVVGVELSGSLAERCRRNLRSFRPRRGGCGRMEVVEGNAQEYEFPSGDLVVYLFNPFGAKTVERVLANLDAVRRREPCRVMVVLLWPRCGDQVMAMEGMRLCAEAKEFQVFAAPAMEGVGGGAERKESGV